MGRPGKIAFPVIIVLGAVTGYLTYTMFTAAIPQVGLVGSAYRQEIVPTNGTGNQNANSTAIDESKFTKKISITILQGAVVQGNPDYDPEVASASSDALLIWANQDSSPHTVTSGADLKDSEMGKLFESGIMNQGDTFKVPASKLGAGEHDYFCSVHPFMKGKVNVQ